MIILSHKNEHNLKVLDVFMEINMIEVLIWFDTLYFDLNSGLFGTWWSCLQFPT